MFSFLYKPKENIMFNNHIVLDQKMEKQKYIDRYKDITLYNKIKTQKYCKKIVEKNTIKTLKLEIKI